MGEDQKDESDGIEPCPEPDYQSESPLSIICANLKPSVADSQNGKNDNCDSIYYHKNNNEIPYYDVSLNKISTRHNRRTLCDIWIIPPDEEIDAKKDRPHKTDTNYAT